MPAFIRTTKTVVAALVAVTVLAACSSPDTTSEPTSETSSATPSTSTTPTPTESAPATTEEEPTPAGPSLSVTIDGEDVQPNAQEIDLAVGEKLTIEFQSNRAGELHVHSTPEQFVKFGAGATSAQLVIKTPGTVEVEEHDTSAVVALIEVR
ncbi:hypothetical protein SAMN05192575_109105 [Nocardioides alpinus]|uniref:EfeO-type cupredoxin-like domain-containing protein n=1 Tax=Nocardioides alpinus TaxID=748909 RepID=A0A1I1AP23_9ACTN|nr:hypothetical protein [Nocardioides alpinus]PKH41764.1 hypothetical protein CXG46_07770 [Nocardioides alpinus]SFB38073.1 hypothetical protein SAMN05192575_109105 [Nocardioides alpinus]